MRRLLEELFVRHYRDVYSYLYGLSRDASLSEDLTSETFLEAVRSIAGFRGEADIKTWLFSIVRHRWYHHLREENRNMETELLAELLVSDGKGPEDACVDRQAVQRIHELLDSEPERTRGIVLMRLRGFSFHEIGRKYGISESSARVIDFRSRARIRRILEKEGFERD